MTDVIIVDNSPIAYMFQPENAIPSISWYEDMSCTELDRIATILEKLAYEEDVRKVIRKIIKNNQIDDKAEQIFLTAQKREHSQKQVESRRGTTAQEGQKAGRNVSHQRFESADNKQKHQAVIQDQMRRQKLDQQFTMTDGNLEEMLKQLKVKRDNYVDEQQQQAETSGKKKLRKDTGNQSYDQKRVQQKTSERGSSRDAVHKKEKSTKTSSKPQTAGSY